MNKGGYQPNQLNETEICSGLKEKKVSQIKRSKTDGDYLYVVRR